MDNLDGPMNFFLNEITSEGTEEPKDVGQPAVVTEEAKTADAADDSKDIQASSDEPPVEDDDSSDETEETETKAGDTQDESAEYSRPETIEELAEALGLTPDEFLSSYKYKAKVNGETQELPLSELGLGYMRQAAFTQNSMQLADARREFEATMETKQTELASKLEDVSQYLELAKKFLKKDAENVNWTQLRAEDPGEYSALQADMLRRENEISNMVNQVRAEQQKLVQSAEAKQQAAFNDWANEEQRVFLTKRPELADDGKRTEFFKGVRDFLQSNGYSDQDFMFLNDHRNLLVVEKAMKYDQLQQKANLKQKQLKSLPKILKPNPSSTKAEVDQKKRDAKTAKLRKSGSVHDAASIFEDMITSGKR